MDALVMTWFDVMKIQPNKVQRVPGSYSRSHKTDWLDKNVWSDWMDVINRFIDEKETIANAIRSGRTIRTKSGMTEHPIDSLGRYFGGPNRPGAYKELVDELEDEHDTGEKLRQRLTNIPLNHQRMEDYMNKMVNKYLTTNGTSTEFTNYRRDAELFGMMASGSGPRVDPKASTMKLLDEMQQTKRKRQTMNFMTSKTARCGVENEIHYALKLLKNISQSKPKKKDNEFDSLMEHIKHKDKDYCKTATKQLIDRVFNFQKMTHCPIKVGISNAPETWVNGSHSWIKEYVNRNHNLGPIKHLAKSSTNPEDYLDMFSKTHPKIFTRDTPLYKEMWPNGTSKMYDFNQKCLKPFRTRLLLIRNFHIACTGVITVEEFERWANRA